MIKKYSFLLMIFSLSLITFNLSASSHGYVVKGVSASTCEKVIELYDLDNKKGEQLLKSVFQSFLTGYNLKHYQNTKKSKNLDMTAAYVFESIMRDCRKNKKEKLYWTLVDFWGGLEWN